MARHARHARHAPYPPSPRTRDPRRYGSLPRLTVGDWAQGVVGLGDWAPDGET